MNTLPLLPPITRRHATLDALVNRVHHCRAEQLLDAIPDASVSAIVTDPPYGFGTQVSARRSPAERFDEIEGVDKINTDWLPCAYRVLREAAAMYVFAKWVNVGQWQQEIERVGFNIVNCIIWDKMQHGTGDLTGAYAPQYEMILLAVKGRHILRGGRPVDILRFPKVQPTELVHPYEKPVGLLEKLLSHSSDAGDLIVDPFSGSGATAVSAIRTKRRFCACDLEIRYVTLARERVRQAQNDLTDLPLFKTSLPLAVSE